MPDSHRSCHSADMMLEVEFGGLVCVVYDVKPLMDKHSAPFGVLQKNCWLW